MTSARDVPSLQRKDALREILHFVCGPPYLQCMIIQLCGLSGSGKTTLAREVKNLLSPRNIPVEIIDGDEYRQHLCADLGFSKEDRNTNIRRLTFVASRFSAHRMVAILCAINPYD